MQSNYYIPQKIKVGFQNRKDTYTGKLGFVIYFDEKNILKQENSWNNWRDHKIEPIEFDNTPRTGYVINKNIQRTSDHFSSGRTVARIYDSRDFEFEISMDNLFGILMNSDLSKCEIEQECVLAWHGQKVVLLPTNCKEYLESQEHTKKQFMEISTKDLVKGATYSLKKETNKYVYLGYFEWFDTAYEEVKKPNGYGYGYRHFMKSKGKKHIFYAEDRSYERFSIIPAKNIAECLNSEPHEKYSDFIIAFEKEIEKRKKEVKN